mmetsp:Transcript_22962/g.71852  ORF Transcript_22962/g.71852 Transcript_22962/m.71852 type:complete len:131 (-) Transcript_22962:1039-1431(-)
MTRTRRPAWRTEAQAPTRCVIMMMVAFGSAASTASRTAISEVASRLEVASSRIRMSGSATIARARSTRCLSPAESKQPPGPQRDPSPSGSCCTVHSSPTAVEAMRVRSVSEQSPVGKPMATSSDLPALWL